METKTLTRRENKVAIQDKVFTEEVTSKIEFKEGYFKLTFGDGTEGIWKDGDGHYPIVGKEYNFKIKFYNYKGQVIKRIIEVERNYHSW